MKNNSMVRVSNQVILKEMPIFQKPSGGGGNIFLVEPKGQRGIHCRFGMPGVSGVDLFHLTFLYVDRSLQLSCL